MKEIKGVRGAREQALPLIIGKDTVYVHTNIRRLEAEEYCDLSARTDGGKTESILAPDLYEYDETQYTLQEWEMFKLSEKAAELENMLNCTQLALTELYEAMQGRL